MIVLDTNVVSEIMKPSESRSAKVFAWLRSYSTADVFTTAISLAEVLAGVAMLPQGKRSIAMQEAADKIFSTVFPQRILPFDETAAAAFAEIITVRRRKGLSFDALDVQIAAIAKTRGMTVATRNTIDFEDCGIDIINPWSD
ncbi:MAG TPA: type II toxin-antitoxin system VapC family toxin [Xanthobacteraceae bacterium]|nr:type II toxin-antitoxin system VapC family toxin [Xanthobacteraceae bacterium]